MSGPNRNKVRHTTYNKGGEEKQNHKKNKKKKKKRTEKKKKKTTKAKKAKTTPKKKGGRKGKTFWTYVKKSQAGAHHFHLQKETIVES